MFKSRMIRLGLSAVGLLVVTTSFAACSKASSEAVLVAAAAGPAGYTWESTNISNVGAYELPSGGKWQKDGLGASNEELDITVSVQVQGGVEPTDREAFMKSLIDVNKRDAPKYEVTAQQNGQVSKFSAGRVDGKFDNGTTYATRDYVIFKDHVALAMMVRGPTGKLPEVQAVADHLATSLK